MVFSEEIINWYNENKRDLPWRGIKNPYKIWISEIILQQTKVKQGIPYYNNFIKTYPTVQHLAKADEEEILKLWQGLGYYSRARNLHFASKQIINNHQGFFPTNYNEILSLKGVGEYTAAAIASFAFNLPYAVLDGNVYRLLARYYGIKTPINSNIGKREFLNLANKLIDAKKANTYNQAIMEFGSQKCKPKNPNCITCPLQKNCVAYKKNKVLELPIKIKLTKKKKLYFDYFFFNYKSYTYVNKREKKGIWQNLYDFPLIEKTKKNTKKSILKEMEKWINEKNYKIISISKNYKHRLSHRVICGRFWEIEIYEEPSVMFSKKIKISNLNTLPTPRLIELFLKQKELELSS